MKEIFRDVPGFENYLISNHGRIKRKYRKIKVLRGNTLYQKEQKERFLKPMSDKDGYLKVDLYKTPKIHGPMRVHRLVAMAFIDNSENKPFINHKDGIKYNNMLDNLEWCTASENSLHAHKNMFYRTHTTKIKPDEVLYIRANQDFMNCVQLGKMFGVTRATIAKILRGETHKYI